MGYALACWQEQARRRAWQAYMAEALRLAGENVARLGGGPYLQTRWTDLLENKPEDPAGESPYAAKAAGDGVEKIPRQRRGMEGLYPFVCW